MAKKRRRSSKRRKKRQFPTEVIGIVLVLVSAFAVGQFGFLGTFLANILRALTGESYIILAGAIIFIGLYAIFKGKFPKLTNRVNLGFLLVYLSVLIFMHWHYFRDFVGGETSLTNLTWQAISQEVLTNTIELNLGGGIIGAGFFEVFQLLLGSPGTFLVIFLSLFVGIMTLGDFSYNIFLESTRDSLVQAGKWLNQVFSRAKSKQASKKSKSKKAKTSKQSQAKEDPKANRQASSAKDLMAQEAASASQETSQEKSALEIESVYGGPAASHQDKPDTEGQEQASPLQKERSQEEDNANSDIGDLDISEEENTDYKLPPLSLLDPVPDQDQSQEFNTIEANVKKLEDTFQSFGVDAKVVKANLGPAVTKYEIQPATGVKVSKIVNLSNDIALALAAKDIRMEAPIPGKAVIGIEVPNNHVNMVSFREVVEGSSEDSTDPLEVAIGRDIAGNIQIANLAKMPHLLIAGATGSGKSVAINGIIASILLKAKPNEVKLMMIDPKMVELNIYNGIPHLLTPVVTNPKKAAQALHKVVQEMERRYELFAASGTRNMASYNEFIQEKNQAKDGEAGLPLPYIVVIVDELADLMMVASNEVENAITRLAQMARAAGIHMILATQRPSVDVITGVVKANIPSRMAFAVSSGTDSRTILDSNGAEKLLGRGDMLYQPMGANKASRVQGAFISDDEVNRIVNHVKNQQDANYIEEMIPTDQDSSGQEEPEDEYYQDAVEMVVELQTASISLLQRRFKIGYNRAARIVDEMEARGVVGPHEGSKPRQVLLESLDSDPDDPSPNQVSEDPADPAD
ncbi:Stage III sporulation protein E [Alloiococcus otitis]|uniref:DNA translocase FtsK n=1 Tax=Alloiococcus otitis ATCC 51267 TaxID=883081 RepID=K9EB38_9LACT|nr:DNA translocase FtsK [Alloiococcus otitis]EKU93071.1 hypothetical protein HMPREF9698_01267 [Alloiococcus otitis ATCC 51267]SUU80823.1 Stage III sporulation protein E [Alloiococcus otitis]